MSCILNFTPNILRSYHMFWMNPCVAVAVVIKGIIEYVTVQSYLNPKYLIRMVQKFTHHSIGATLILDEVYLLAQHIFIWVGQS